MITSKEAFESAKQFNRRIDYCVEYTDGVLFGWKDHNDFAKEKGLVVVFQTDGEKVKDVSYYDGYEAKEVS